MLTKTDTPADKHPLLGHGSGHGLVTVLVTITNLPESLVVTHRGKSQS